MARGGGSIYGAGGGATGFIGAFIMVAVGVLIVINFIGPVGAAVNDLVPADVGTTTQTILAQSTLVLGAGVILMIIRAAIGRG